MTQQTEKRLHTIPSLVGVFLFAMLIAVGTRFLCQEDEPRGLGTLPGEVISRSVVLAVRGANYQGTLATSLAQWRRHVSTSLDSRST
jgi:hypothetical protein